MILARRIPGKRTGSNGQVLTALRGLGVPDSMLYRPGVRLKRTQGFWSRRVDHLAILYRARSLWRTRLKECHPDRPGGCARKTLELNALWSRVKKSFSQKGFAIS